MIDREELKTRLKSNYYFPTQARCKYCSMPIAEGDICLACYKNRVKQRIESEKEFCQDCDGPCDQMSRFCRPCYQKRYYCDGCGINEKVDGTNLCEWCLNVVVDENAGEEQW